MSETLTISIKTLTPIWTGDVNGRCSEIKETGIIGSLRWWYEAIVQGMGGYACDPTGDDRCNLSGKEKTDEEIRKKMCPACYLFGCGGWKRKFQLQIEDAPTTPLHFRTTVDVNKKWLIRIFGGESKNIDNLKVFHGDIMFRFTFRGRDDADYNYIHSQLIMLLLFISKYGGLGAKMQHGFGQVQVVETAPAIENGLKTLSQRIHADEFFQEELSSNMIYNLKNFICLEYDLSESSIAVFKNINNHLGNKSKINEDKYLPCSFDLRYKGSTKFNFGMRVWLERTEGQSRHYINEFMGVSEKKGESLSDEYRASSRICFGMPHKLNNNNYRLRIFGFAPPSILNPDDLKALCEKYMRHSFGKDCKSLGITFGREIIKIGKGGG